MFVGSRFASHGPVALVNDVFCVPGELILKGDKLQMVALRESPPSATDLALCLAKLLAHFGNPWLLGKIQASPILENPVFRPKVGSHR